MAKTAKDLVKEHESNIKQLKKDMDTLQKNENTLYTNDQTLVDNDKYLTERMQALSAGFFVILTKLIDDRIAEVGGFDSYCGQLVDILFEIDPESTQGMMQNIVDSMVGAERAEMVDALNAGGIEVK